MLDRPNATTRDIVSRVVRVEARGGVAIIALNPLEKSL
jgi:hypothetical protein